MMNSLFQQLSLAAVALLLIGGADGLRAQEDAAGSILQREEIRRQELMLKANMQLDQATAMVRQNQTEEAAALLEDVLANVPNVGVGAEIHQRASLILSEVETRRAQDKLAQRDWFGARDLANRARELNPANVGAAKIVAKANKELGADENGETNPAVNPRFIERYNKVQDLIASGKDHVATGQYQKAEEAFKEALTIDPYNRVAIKELKQLNVILRETAEIAHDSVNRSRIAEVADKASEEISVAEQAPQLVDTQAVLEASNQSLLGDKLKNIIIPDVDFSGASIADAASFLTVKTRELDPVENGGGVPFIVKDEAVSQSRPFNLQLRNVPAGEVLRYATNLAGVKFKVAEYAVFIVPLTTLDDETVITREFPVTPSFWDVSAAEEEEVGGGVSARLRRRSEFSPTTTSSERRGFDAKAVLEKRGVDFSAAGSTAIYNDATGILTVTNTQNQIDLIEELVIGTNTETLLVKVETKFIEINQTELDSLVPNIRLQGSYAYPGTSGSNIAGGAVQAGTNLGGPESLRLSDALERFLRTDTSIPDIIANPTNLTPDQNNIGITGFLDGNAFAALINALSQADSTELLTAPSLVVNSGEQGTITIAREFWYPEEYDPPQVSTGNGLLLSNSAISFRFTATPAFPKEFVSRNVGVVMSVNPRISVDRQRVYLNIDPEVIEFDGFINYGAEIFGPLGNDPTIDLDAASLTKNEIKQPVFNVRTIENAQVEVQDGFTVVLGGLLREEVNTVEEKVPLLGDIPLLGRAFRSEVEQSIRRNLLIFVSVRILRPDGQPYNLQGAGPAAAQNTAN